MAAFVKFVSYNLRGLRQGRMQLLELCNLYDIIAVQEHWLPDHDLQTINNLHKDFITISRSAMSQKLQAGFLVGRPFCGLAIMVRKSVCANVRLLGFSSNCHCLSVSITLHSDFKLLVNVVYLPRADCSAEYKVV